MIAKLHLYYIFGVQGGVEIHLESRSRRRMKQIFRINSKTEMQMKQRYHEKLLLYITPTCCFLHLVQFLNLYSMSSFTDKVF